MSVKISLLFESDEFGNLLSHHPALCVGSSYCSLNEEAQAWMNENVPKKFWRFEHDYESYCIIFDRDQDAVLFALRWS
jgi:hypothetical protein